VNIRDDIGVPKDGRLHLDHVVWFFGRASGTEIKNPIVLNLP